MHLTLHNRQNFIAFLYVGEQKRDKGREAILFVQQAPLHLHVSPVLASG